MIFKKTAIHSFPKSITFEKNISSSISKEILEECFTARRIAGLPICKVTYFYLYFLKIRFVGVVENSGRLLMQQPVPIVVLLGFHFLVKSSVVICFAHSEHLLQSRNSRLISFENQAAMYAIFSSTNWNLSLSSDQYSSARRTIRTG